MRDRYFVRWLLILLMICSFALLSFDLIGIQLLSSKSLGSWESVETVNVGIYWDLNCDQPVSFIDWGDVKPESVKHVSLVIRNEGTLATVIFLRAKDWQPLSASEFISLSWNYNGRILDPFKITIVTVTLRLSPHTKRMESVSFDIVIGASAYSV